MDRRKYSIHSIKTEHSDETAIRFVVEGKNTMSRVTLSIIRISFWLAQKDGLCIFVSKWAGKQCEYGGWKTLLRTDMCKSNPFALRFV